VAGGTGLTGAAGTGAGRWPPPSPTGPAYRASQSSFLAARIRGPPGARTAAVVGPVWRGARSQCQDRMGGDSRTWCGDDFTRRRCRGGAVRRESEGPARGGAMRKGRGRQAAGSAAPDSTLLRRREGFTLIEHVCRHDRGPKSSRCREESCRRVVHRVGAGVCASFVGAIPVARHRELHHCRHIIRRSPPVGVEVGLPARTASRRTTRSRPLTPSRGGSRSRR